MFWPIANKWEQVQAQRWSFASSMASGQGSPAQNVLGEIQTNEGLSFPELRVTLKLVFRFVLSREYKGSQEGKALPLS